MPLIKLQSFSGMMPRYSANLLPETSAVMAKDCHFDDGTLNPVKTNKDTGETVAANTQTLFRYENQYWFTWDHDVDAIKSPIASDPYRRVYYTGDGYPKVTYNTIFNGVTMPANAYQLGVPAPTTSPSITTYTPATAENAVTSFYVMTYISGNGEEGAPSPVSVEVKSFPIGVVNNAGVTGQVVLLLGAPTFNRSNITRIKLYRTTTGAGAAEFLEVANLPLSQTNYTDITPDYQLGAILETEEYSMPPDDMKGLCSMANGICAGFKKNELLFSEAYLPYAWPEAFRLSTSEDIVAIEPIGTSLVVGTEGDPYLFTGISPANIAGQKLEISQSCMSKLSMLNVGPAVLYASPDGLVAVAPDGVRLITEEVLSPMQWREMVDPSTIRAYRHEAKYIAIHSRGAFSFDPITKDLRLIDDTWTAGYGDLTDDTLYMLNGTKVMHYRGGDDYKNLTWKSKEFDAIAKSFSCVRLISDDITQVSFKLVVDGNEIMNKAAGSVIQTFTLPYVRGDKWQFEVESKSRIESIKLATSKQELKQ